VVNQQVVYALSSLGNLYGNGDFAGEWAAKEEIESILNNEIELDYCIFLMIRSINHYFFHWR